MEGFDAEILKIIFSLSLNLIKIDYNPTTQFVLDLIRDESICYGNSCLNKFMEVVFVTS